MSPEDNCLFIMFAFSSIYGLFNDLVSIKSIIQRRITGCMMHNQLDVIWGAGTNFLSTLIFFMVMY